MRRLAIWLLCFSALSLFLQTRIFAEVPPGTQALRYSIEQLANAIYKAENSKSHPYGILAHYKHTTPRQACINTIKSALKRWNGKGDFIVFLSRTYCPIGANNDPHNLNKNWVKNVKHFLDSK